jgi:hypothetical protein
VVFPFSWAGSGGVIDFKVKIPAGAGAGTLYTQVGVLGPSSIGLTNGVKISIP